MSRGNPDLQCPGFTYARQFRARTLSQGHRLAACRSALKASGKRLHNRDTCAIVLERLLYQLVRYPKKRGAWISSRLLAEFCHVSEQAVTRALYRLRDLGWISWENLQEFGAPIRHFRPYRALVVALDSALERIRKIRDRNPKKHKPQISKLLTKPVFDVFEWEPADQKPATGNDALAQMRAALGRRKPPEGVA